MGLRHRRDVREITRRGARVLAALHKWSGQEDLNLRPHGPEPCALTRLSYAPGVEDAPEAARKRNADSRGTAQPGQTGPSGGSFRQKRQASPVLTMSGRTFIF